MGIIATFIISFALVSINVGFGKHFLKIWLRSWGIAYLISIPVSLFLAPIVQRFINHMVFPESKTRT
jgi:hypothetical protein